MDIYAETHRYLNNLWPVATWPELSMIIEKRANSHPAYWHIPVTLSVAAGAVEEQAIPAVAAVAAMQTAILLVDDVLDNDGRVESLHLSHGDIANLAAAFQALSLECIMKSPFSSSQQLLMVACLNRMALQTAFGQYWDTKTPEDEAAYWQVVQTKSSPFFQAAFEMGTLASGGSGDLTSQVGRLGSVYGEMIQIHDDLGDVMEVPANSDWIQMRNPLPVLFAQVVKHPLRNRFLALRKIIHQPAALEEAQAILLECGAISYCLDQLVKRHQAALKILAETRLAQPQIIEAEFDPLMKPVQSLLALAAS